MLATADGTEEVCCFAKSGKELNVSHVPNCGGNLDGIASLSDGNIAVSLGKMNCVAVYRPNGVFVKKCG